MQKKKKKFWTKKKKKKKKNLGVPLAFFRIFSRFFFAEFLTFDGWHC